MTAKGKIILFTTILIFSSLALSVRKASSEVPDNNSFKARIDVVVHDLNVKTGNATISIDVSLFNETSSFPTVLVIISGGGTIELNCGSTDYGYDGKINGIEWKTKAVGDFYPYDYYILNFWIQQVYVRNGSDTLRFEDNILLDSNSSGRIILNDYSRLEVNWKTVDQFGTLARYSFDASGRKFGVEMSKNSNFSNYVLLIPIFGANFFLGASFAVNSKKYLRERITIFFAIFAFSSVFMFSIQPYLPLHSSLTIIEFLNLSLVMGVSIFGTCTLISIPAFQILRKRWVLYLIDAIASIVAMILFAYLYLVIYMGGFILVGIPLPNEAILSIVLFEWGYSMGVVLLCCRIHWMKRFDEETLFDDM